MKKIMRCLLAFAFAHTAKAQTITDLQAYYKLGGTRVTTLLSDNTIWWYTEDKGWQQLPTAGMENKALTKLGVYVKTGIGAGDTRMVATTADNSIWWYADGKSAWEQIPRKGLPQNSTIKIFTPYFKPSGMGWSGETRYFLADNDNKMWWYGDDEWKPVPSEGLPNGFDMKFLKTYQKYGMMGSSETRYISVLKDNTLWWTTGKKWQQVEANGLPDKTDIKLFDAYMKYGIMGNNEGRLVSVLADNTFRYLPVQNKKWVSIANTGLPSGYKVKLLKVYQKYGSGDDARLIVALEDDSLWWYAENKGWTSISTRGLKLIK